MGIFSRKKKPEEIQSGSGEANSVLVDTSDHAAASETVDLAQHSEVEPDVAEAGGDSQQRGFYRAIEALTATQHAALKVDRGRSSFDFAKGVNLAPISVAEFPQVALSYPIVFVGESKTPCAVMGLRRGVNAFIDADGSVDGSHYLPAAIRQYPFALVKDAKSGRYVLCIDRGADVVNEETGTPLFVDDKPSPLTEDAMKFLRAMEGQRVETEGFVQRLRELDVFETKELKLMKREAPGESRVLTTYGAVSEKKLAALPAETLQELVQKNFMFPISAHHVSLFNWNRLTMMSLRAGRDEPQRAAS